jgi:hypothetical protein
MTTGRERMTRALVRYLGGDKEASHHCLLLGSVGLVAASLAWPRNGLLAGLAPPLLLAGLVALAAGSALFLRCDRLLRLLRRELEHDPVRFRRLELARVRRLGHNLLWLETVAAGLLAAAVVLWLGRPRSPFLAGLGLGTMIAATALLALGLLASRRAAAYLVELERFQDG